MQSVYTVESSNSIKFFDAVLTKIISIIRQENMSKQGVINVLLNDVNFKTDLIITKIVVFI